VCLLSEGVSTGRFTSESRSTGRALLIVITIVARPRPANRDTVGRVDPGSGRVCEKGLSVVKTLLVILCLFLPWVAVLLKEGLSLKVLWAFLLQLCGHVPGVIYGIYVVVRD
jgi:uncharacterized membrane protein YqaE (UPF0057 family)